MQQSTIKLQFIYAICALAGIVLTMYYNLQFVLQYQGFSLTTFINDVYINFASSSIGNDLMVIWAVFILWSFIEARRLKISNWWIYPLLSCTVAVAFAIPVFLLMRERRLAEIN